MQALGTELNSSGRTTSVLNHRVISPHTLSWLFSISLSLSLSISLFISVSLSLSLSLCLSFSFALFLSEVLKKSTVLSSKAHITTGLPAGTKEMKQFYRDPQRLRCTGMGSDEAPFLPASLLSTQRHQPKSRLVLCSCFHASF